jgi:hypothetical protein
MPNKLNEGVLTLEFKRCLRGELIQPDDKGYDEARKVYNGIIDGTPV